MSFNSVVVTRSVEGVSETTFQLADSTVSVLYYQCFCHFWRIGSAVDRHAARSRESGLGEGAMPQHLGQWAPRIWSGDGDGVVVEHRYPSGIVSHGCIAS